VLIGAAVFVAAFGLLGWRMSRRKSIPAAGVTTFLGVVGVYAGFWGVMENRHWLYFPCVLLMLASYAIQFAALRRAARGGKTAGIPDSGPTRE
jgi:drug/metabolite transporter (DMT)-like permease